MSTPRRTESRFYTTIREDRRPAGASTRTIECPYCGCYTEARLWSLAGSGKRCECGALLLHDGTAERNRP